MDFDLTLTVIAAMLYQRLAAHLKGFAKSTPQTLFYPKELVLLDALGYRCWNHRLPVRVSALDFGEHVARRDVQVVFIHGMDRLQEAVLQQIGVQVAQMLADPESLGSDELTSRWVQRWVHEHRDIALE